MIAALKPILSTTIALLAACSARAETWPQAAGPHADWKVSGRAPVEWSVAQNRNIKWRTILPEGGQSAVTIWEDRLFVTTHLPLKSSADIA